MPDISDLLAGQDQWMSGLTDINPLGDLLQGGADWLSGLTPDLSAAGGGGIGELVAAGDKWLTDYNNLPNIFSDPNNTVSDLVVTAAGGGSGGRVPLPDPMTVAGAIPGARPTQPSGTLDLPHLPNIPSIPGVTAPRPTTASPPPPAHPTTPTSPPAPGGAGGAGGGVTIPSLGDLGKYAPLLAMIPGIMGAINSKDQTDLGPDAAKMRALADKNAGLADSLSAEAQAEKMGNLPGPALASLAASTAEQRAAMRQRYSQMGMSGSSAEGADMAALNQQAEGQRFQIGLGMASEALGQVQNLNTADIGIYKDLMTAQAQRDEEYMQAMAELMKGLGTALTQPSQTNVVQGGTGGAGGGTAQEVRDRVTGSGPGSSTPIDPNLLKTALPLVDPLLQVAGGVDPSTLVTPQTTVPDLVTPASLPDLSMIDPSQWTQDQVAASDFLSAFPGREF